jgi:hypothetical protein
MTVGTGFFGGSSLTESLQPKHLVQWTRVAYASDPSVQFDDFEGLAPWRATPAAQPIAVAEPFEAQESAGEPALSRDELRRLILAELREVVRT